MHTLSKLKQKKLCQNIAFQYIEIEGVNTIKEIPLLKNKIQFCDLDCNNRPLRNLRLK